MSAASPAFYVLDGSGNKFCFTVADLSYEPDFRKHAEWWMRTGWKHTADKLRSDGHWYRAPMRPFRVVIEVRE